ncbi:MAG: thioredoxin family protein [Phycisphaerales bacterium]|nr:thioredoxin family protein [Phycisphaerales bacterium]
MKNFKGHFLSIVFLALIAYMVAPKVINMVQGPAPLPTMFAHNYNIERATIQSETTGKPILILVTADWCPPCQALKKGALSDPKVTDWVNANMIPVYLEDGADQDQIRLLPVRSYPTTIVLKDGQILGQFTGNKSASAFLSRIKDSVSSL